MDGNRLAGLLAGFRGHKNPEVKKLRTMQRSLLFFAVEELNDESTDRVFPVRLGIGSRVWF